MEGDSVNISCNSVGNPLPSIRWRLGMNDAPFGQVTESTPLSYSGGTTENPTFSFAAGDITSMLLIVNAVYPDHSGDYECLGVNSHNGVKNVSTGATITVDVLCQWLTHAEHEHGCRILFSRARDVITKPLLVVKEHAHCIVVSRVDVLFPTNSDSSCVHVT